MFELPELLRRHGFRAAIVSGGGTDFLRVWAEAVCAIPPELMVTR